MCERCKAAEEHLVSLWDEYHREDVTPAQRISTRAKIKHARAELTRIRNWNHGQKVEATEEDFELTPPE